MNPSDLSDSGKLEELNPTSDPRWDEFVRGHPSATVYHYSAWTQVLCETYGHTPFYLGLVTSDGQQLLGILPFVLINSLLTGKRLVSLPFTAYCNSLMPATRMEEALRFAFNRHRGVRYVELRLLDAQTADEVNSRLGQESPFVSQILPLTKDINELFRSFHQTSVRQPVGRAARDGLVFRLAESESELRRFYQFLTEIRSRQGLPSPPYKFYANMRCLLAPKNLFELPVVEFNGSVIAAALVLKGKSTWHYEYAASDARYLRHGANQLLIWECIKRAHQQGAAHFDFGRTALWHHTLLVFKDRWRTERHPIRYRIFPDNAETPRWHDTSDSLLVRLNKRLPSRFLQWEGCVVYRHRS
jgi:CelD/BcsL family acetyltransferase involved in cellulose biosynthesis